MDEDILEVKPIIKSDNPLLREVSVEVTEFDDDLQTLVEDMFKTMLSNNGVGLSAVQIGIPKRVILAMWDRTLHILVNPAFVRKLNRFTTEEEGCLSLPGVKRKVSRPAKCEIAFQDLQGHYQIVNYSGMMARIIQHEIDHLDGILITDKPQPKF